MRILVAGATGYVGSRLVPVLTGQGHEVVAASSRDPRPERYSWGPGVEPIRMQATDAEQVRLATRGVDAVCYLVHSLVERDFPARDRLAARVMRDAVDENAVGRVVYLSGLVPSGQEDGLSPHLASRLEVERLLLESTASTLSLRAGVVIGAGSTSFEIVRQLASLLLVQPVPPWLSSRIQPVAVADVVRALADAVTGEAARDVVGSVDVGGPDVVTYPELLHAYCESAGLLRVQLPVVGPSVTLTALSAGLATAAPFWTVAALVRSLRHDMVCREGHPDPRVLDPASALPLTRALADAVAQDGAAGLEPSDPDWVQSSRLERSIAATRLPGSTLLSSALHVADHRARALRGLLG